MRKKLIVFNDMLFGGGVEKLMLDFVCHWNEQYDVTVVTDYYEDGFYDVYPADVKYLPRRPRKVENSDAVGYRLKKHYYMKAVEAQIAKTHYDIAIAIKDGWKIKEVAEQFDAKVKIAWVHTDYNAYYYTENIFGSKADELNVLKKYDKVICVSESIRVGIVDTLGDPGNLAVCYNPIHDDVILTKSMEPVVEPFLDTERKKVRFVSVGRLNWQKGYDILLQACRMLQDDGLGYEMLIIGGDDSDGVINHQLQSDIRMLNLKNVWLLGHRINSAKYIASADWFISSSRFEGFSIVSQEATILGTPCLLTDCGGVKELLGENEYGIVMDHSARSIYDAMKSVILDKSIRDFYASKINEKRGEMKFNYRVEIIDDILRVCSER